MKLINIATTIICEKQLELCINPMTILYVILSNCFYLIPFLKSHLLL